MVFSCGCTKVIWQQGQSRMLSGTGDSCRARCCLADITPRWWLIAPGSTLYGAVQMTRKELRVDEGDRDVQLRIEAKLSAEAA